MKINERLDGVVAVRCPRGCGVVLETPAVFYAAEVKDERDASRIPIEAPDLPGEMLLHWIDCPHALAPDD